ncbi:MAG TPA: hypothetical protein VHZ50_03190, partial [Puia sp.]|nr:hypothetical protein [Puia sp.]
AALSSGEFVGMVADNPEQPIALKMFHSQIQNDHKAIAQEEARYKPIPEIGQISEEDVLENYIRIKAEIDELIQSELMVIEANKVLEEHQPPIAAKNDDIGEALSM